jgi:hypothetical protein
MKKYITKESKEVCFDSGIHLILESLYKGILSDKSISINTNK